MYDVLDCTLRTKLRKPYFNNEFSKKLGWSSSFPYFTNENIFVHQNQNSKLQIDQSAFLHGLAQSPSMFYWLCRYLSLVINFVGILCWLLAVKRHNLCFKEYVSLVTIKFKAFTSLHNLVHLQALFSFSVITAIS